METQEQKNQTEPVTEIQEKSKKKNVKLFLIIISIAVLFVGVYFLFLRGGSSTPSIELIPYKSGEKWGYIDKEGKILINPQFEEATVFIDGIALVRSADNKYGYIGEDGKYIVNPTYKYALPFSEGLACVVPENGKPQFIDKKNNVKFTVNTGEACGSFNDVLAPVKVEDKYGYINKEGKMIINPQFDKALPFNEGLAAVATINKDKGEVLYGFINKKGEIIINPQFKYAGSFSEGLALVYDGKKCGYIDKNGKYIINPQFDNAGFFKNGMATIIQGSMYGYINKEGKIIINPQFKMALNFSEENDIALVWSSDGKAGFIDKDGKYLINPQFEEGTDFYGDIAFVQSADKWGIINKEGKYLVNPQFDEINVDFESYKYKTVESDYFDIAGIIQKFLTGTDQKNFRGLNSNSTFIQIVTAAGGKDKFDVNERNNYAVYRTKEQLSKEVTISKVRYYFDNLIAEQKPIYRTVRKYDYWQGYYNAQELDHYEYIFNDNAKLTSASYSFDFSGKAQEKSYDLYIALIGEMATKLGVKSNLLQDILKSSNAEELEQHIPITMNNDEIEITIDKSGDIDVSFVSNSMLEMAIEQARADSIAAVEAAAEKYYY